VVGGSGPTSSPSSLLSNFGLARLNADGSVDTTFGSNGQTITPVGSTDNLDMLLQQPDGKILTVGSVEFTNDAGTLTAIGVGLLRFAGP
jgi:hypothetical protein